MLALEESPFHSEGFFLKGKEGIKTSWAFKGSSRSAWAVLNSNGLFSRKHNFAYIHWKCAYYIAHIADKDGGLLTSAGRWRY